MLYLLYERLADNHHYIPVLNLLRYLTFRSGLSLITAQLTVVAMGSRFIRWMQAQAGQGPADPRRRHRAPHRREGRHADHGRADVPGRHRGRHAAVGRPHQRLRLDRCSSSRWPSALLGFLDDYAKVTKQSTAGISGWCAC